MVGAGLLLAASLGGCATATTGSLMDAHAEASSPAQPGDYLPVEDLPPDRQLMSGAQQSKLKTELSAARDRQAASVKAQGGPLPPMEVPPAQPADQPARQ